MQKIVPEVLKRLRLSRRFSQDELATRSKIDKQTIHRLEKASNEKTREHTIQQLSRALGVEPAVLTGEKHWDDQDENNSYFLMSKLGFRISTSTHNAMHLTADRYHVKYADIVELAPFLFCWAAEASLKRRRNQLEQVELALERAQEAQSKILHLDAPDLTEFEQAIAAERESIEGKDIFGLGLSLDQHFKPEDWRDNPFAVFLDGLTETIGEDAIFDGYGYQDYPIYRVCAEEAERYTEGDKELAEHILEGHVALGDLPKDCQGLGKYKERAEWVRSKVAEFHNEMLKRL